MRLRTVLLLLLGLVLLVVEHRREVNARAASCESCLPDGLKLSTEFSDGDHKRITVGERLVWLGAYPADDAIYDRWGRTVGFHWYMQIGTQNEDYAMMQRQEEARVKTVKQQYGVVVWMLRPKN